MNSKQTRQIWDTYTSAWAASTAEAKATALQASVEADGVYRDPLCQAAGHPALIEYMLSLHQQIPGAHFKTLSFRAHNARSLANWQMCNADGVVVGEGQSYGEYAAGGKLVAMTGFFDLPAQPPAP
jgi:hypothetical protein